MLITHATKLSLSDTGYWERLYILLYYCDKKRATPKQTKRKRKRNVLWDDDARDRRHRPGRPYHTARGRRGSHGSSVSSSSSSPQGTEHRHRNNMHCKILQYLSSRNMILQYENILQYHIAIFWYFAILIAILAILQYIVQYCASKNHHQAMVNLWAQPLRPLCFTKS